MYGNKWFIMRGNNSQACTLINCPKQHNNPLNVPKITNRRAKSQNIFHKRTSRRARTYLDVPLGHTEKVLLTPTGTLIHNSTGSHIKTNKMLSSGKTREWDHVQTYCVYISRLSALIQSLTCRVNIEYLLSLDIVEGKRAVPK